MEQDVVYWERTAGLQICCEFVDEIFSEEQHYTYKGAQHSMVLVLILFCILEIKLFCFVVAMSDVVYNVEFIFHLP